MRKKLNKSYIWFS